MSDKQTTAEKQRKLTVSDGRAALAESSAKLKQAAAGADARNSDAVDFVDGNVSEVMADSGDADGGNGRVHSDDNATSDTATTATGGIAAITIPAPKVVLRKLKTTINSEIATTNSKIKTMQRRPLHNAAALVATLNTLHKLHDLLVALAEKTWDELKKLWVSLQQGQKLAELA